VWNRPRFVLAAVLISGCAVAAGAEESTTQKQEAPGGGDEANTRRTFSTITLEGTALGEFGDDAFQDYWEPGFGGEIAVLTPVPHGYLELAVHPFANDPTEPDLPRVRTLGTYMGWGFDLSLPQHTLFRAGARAGVFWMLYDETADSPAQDENEVAIGGRASLQYPLTHSLGIQAGMRYARVLTKKEIDFIFLGGGFAWTFSSPDWLRGFLE